MSELERKYYTSIAITESTRDKMVTISRETPLNLEQVSMNEIIAFSITRLSKADIAELYKSLPLRGEIKSNISIKTRRLNK